MNTAHTVKKDKVKQEKSYATTECDKVGEIAVQYGFTVIKPPHIKPEHISKAKQFKDFDYYSDAEEKAALTEWYINERKETESQPIAIHYKKPLHRQEKVASPGTRREGGKKPNQEVYGFEVMGSGRSTSEALVMKCVLAVLGDLGYKDLYVDINSIGDKESISKFERELSGYFRKHRHDLTSKLRQEMRKNYYSILADKSEEAKDFRKNAPQPIAMLSDIARAHFKEVLECMEAFDIAYKINPSVLSNKLYASYTVFEIRQTPTTVKEQAATDGTLLAYGYRYNHLAKKLGAKREIPSIGVTLFVKKQPSLSKKVIIKNIKRPKFYLVQLGPSAKLKALNVVEMLRKEKIPVYHSITKDKITGQLSGAEYMRATHVLVMGQKEAMENTIIVRNIANREQETVPLPKLAEFLKKL